MRIGQATFAEEDTIDDMMVTSDKVKKSISFPGDACWEQTVPLGASVVDRAFVADCVQAFDVLEARAQYIHSHAFSHSLSKISHADVLGVQVRPCMPFTGENPPPFRVESAVCVLEYNERRAVDESL